jgi:hypothetical protein
VSGGDDTVGEAAPLLRILNGASSKLWIWFGVLAGISLENKHTMLLLGFGLVAGLLLMPARRLLWDRWLWVGCPLQGSSPARRIVDPYAMPYESNLTVRVCRGPKAPLRVVWPRVKHYD